MGIVADPGHVTPLQMSHPYRTVMSHPYETLLPHLPNLGQRNVFL